jgi:Uncharacterised protein family (UPF0182)
MTRRAHEAATGGIVSANWSRTSTAHPHQSRWWSTGGQRSGSSGLGNRVRLLPIVSDDSMKHRSGAGALIDRRVDHMTNPQVFYNREDLWTVATDVSAVAQPEKAAPPMEPDFLLMRLPGERDMEFVEILPFTPATGTTRSAVRCCMRKPSTSRPSAAGCRNCDRSFWRCRIDWSMPRRSRRRSLSYLVPQEHRRSRPHLRPSQPFANLPQPPRRAPRSGS